MIVAWIPVKHQLHARRAHSRCTLTWAQNSQRVTLGFLGRTQLRRLLREHRHHGRQALGPALLGSWASRGPGSCQWRQSAFTGNRHGETLCAGRQRTRRGPDKIPSRPAAALWRRFWKDGHHPTDCSVVSPCLRLTSISICIPGSPLGSNVYKDLFWNLNHCRSPEFLPCEASRQASLPKKRSSESRDTDVYPARPS